MCNPIELAIALNAVGLVSGDVKERMQIDPGKTIHNAELVMADVERELNASRDIEKYETFCQILIDQKSDLYVKRNAEDMKRDLEKWKVDTGYYLDRRANIISEEVTDAAGLEEGLDRTKHLVGSHKPFQHVLMEQRDGDSMLGIRSERRSDLIKWKKDTDFHLDWLVIIIIRIYS